MCTSYRNAECGECLPGYYKSNVVFDCVECDKCCYDDKDVAPPGCQKVGKCKPRLHGCPSTYSTAIIPKPTTKPKTGWMASTLHKKKTTSPTPNPTTKAKVQPLSIRHVLSTTLTSKIKAQLNGSKKVIFTYMSCLRMF